MKHQDQNQTRPSLLLRIRDRKDTLAWRTFVRIYTPLIFGYCRFHGLQEADAADVTQEVLVKVSKGIGNFEYDAGKGRFRDWLGVVTRGELIRYLNKHQVQQARGGSGTGWRMNLEDPGKVDPSWIEQFQSHILDMALQRICTEFETQTWEAFSLAWMHDHTAQRVAEQLELPIERVYVAKSRVLKRLRQEILLLAEDFPHPSPHL